MADYEPPRWFIALTMTSALTAQCLAGAMTTTNDASTREVLHREHQYSTARLHGHIDLLASVLADSFVDTSESGALRNKQQLLRVIADQAPPASIEETGRKIHIYGNTAVVTVKFEVSGNDHGIPHKSASRATDVWVIRNGQWYCAAAHSSAITSAITSAMLYRARRGGMQLIC